MLIGMIIMIGVIGGISITSLLSYKKEIKDIQEQLEEINTEQTNKKVRLKAPNKNLEGLVKAINESLEKKKQIEANHIHMDRELRQAIANMSHDLRTPLTSIIGYLQLMEDLSIEEDTKKKYNEIVKKRAKALQNLITSFYDLSRIEANEYQIELKIINISTILCELIAGFYNEFVDKGLELRIEIDEKVESIIGDDKAVERIFSNLIQNVLKYAKEEFIITHKKEGNQQVTSFTNDAEELMEDEVKHLFDRFFTTDRMRTGQSTGLGLAITKQLVEQMGHKIEAKLQDKKLTIQITWNSK